MKESQTSGSAQNGTKPSSTAASTTSLGRLTSRLGSQHTAQPATLTKSTYAYNRTALVIGTSIRLVGVS